MRTSAAEMKTYCGICHRMVVEPNLFIHISGSTKLRCGLRMRTIFRRTKTCSTDVRKDCADHSQSHFPQRGPFKFDVSTHCVEDVKKRDHDQNQEIVQGRHEVWRDFNVSPQLSGSKRQDIQSELVKCFC